MVAAATNPPCDRVARLPGRRPYHRPVPALPDVDRPTPAVVALRRVLDRKAGGQTRPGQEAMCAAVEAALDRAEHLLVEAPTGTGKSLAYLVPAVLFATSGPDRHRVVVVTATKALQEQLVGEDLPFLADALSPDGVTFSFAMLKGRSNYLCRAKLAVSQHDGVEARLDFGPGGPQAAVAAVAELAQWAEESGTGDRAEAPRLVSDTVWLQVSVDAGECPGAAKCGHGDRCFAEAARRRAAEADIVVVNSHLYATHLAAGGGVLPEHHAVVFDEAHTLEGIVCDVFGLRLSGGRVRRLAARLRRAGGSAESADRLERAATMLEGIFGRAGPDEPTRVWPTEGDLAESLAAVVPLVAVAAAELRRQDPTDDVSRSKVLQASRLADGLAEDLARLLDPALSPNHVAWVESTRGGERSELRLATVDVGPLLAAWLYPKVTAVATSATLATAGRFDLLAHRLGLTLPAPGGGDPEGEVPATGPPAFFSMAVPSPFDHRRQAYLYVPTDLPDPRQETFPAAMHEELHALITAAGGRTLALFTSRSAMERAAEALSGLGSYEVLVQDRLPRSQLLARFRAGPGSALLATQSFWSGIDLPGSLCHLVTIDRIPFRRPTDPLAQARREAAVARGANAFAAVDLPVAATLLAQGAGRLIRSAADEGVVAVFDRRLATARYRPTLLATLPPFRRTIDRAEVLGALQRLAASPA